jgi:hypothetical protein
MAEPQHLDRRKSKRQGWFKKAKDGKPAHKNYTTSCKSGGRGFLGPRFEAHHIVPQTSIDESKAEYLRDSTEPEAGRYVEDVQWITVWNINQPDNMVGLPTYHSYDQFMQLREKLASARGDPDRAKALVKWFNKFSKKTRKKWLAAFKAGSSPEKHPIHNPVCWGHAEYNKFVKNDVRSMVWNKLQIKKRDHQFDAKTVATELKNLSDDWLDALTTRAEEATAKRWEDRGDPDWHAPFTMADVPNPL